MKSDSRIYVAGHAGLVGASLVRKLREDGFTNLLLKTRSELDLAKSGKVLNFFEDEKPEYVFLCAARCGGIGDIQSHPVEYLQDNLEIQNNVIKSSHKTKVKKLLFLGSANVYPPNCSQPIKEEDLLSGYLEPTSESYSLAKIAGVKLCQAYRKQYDCNFISIQPCNIYGPLTKFNASAGVIGSLIDKFHKAKGTSLSSIVCWGSGVARREFLYVEDLVDACVFLMQNYDEYDTINVGSGVDHSIREIAYLIKTVIGYEGSLEWDGSQPDGMLRKLLDSTKLYKMGWKPSIPLKDGLKLTYEYYKLGVN